MPWSPEGGYEAPAGVEIVGCACSKSVCAPDYATHDETCPISREIGDLIWSQAPRGASLPSFAHEWESVGDPSEGPTEKDPSKVGFLVAALLEEQRTANLIAIANSSVFSTWTRENARAEVVARIGQPFMDDEQPSLWDGKGA